MSDKMFFATHIIPEKWVIEIASITHFKIGRDNRFTFIILPYGLIKSGLMEKGLPKLLVVLRTYASQTTTATSVTSYGFSNEI